MNTLEKDLMTVDDLIEQTGLGRTKINDLLKRGELASLKVGARRLVRTSVYIDWLDSLESKNN
ncbi:MULTISPECIES: helix-turn-helix transcriptional regulator [unclassified Rhodococcus (in: high G+C Gram-positive bacteria)]|uniref:helix-turn-helix transcriptional regulator n=1 Tax=unclassified Rhodococcus (in: high G+C Gram-positive bacteria) TaxID=192944 RepID=UPI001C5282A7|nr:MULTISPECIES: helix-turn-helix domain-containing protein [unclassified Rhodococcus (in: high G+C Gram-positive bacteria)]